MPDHKIDNALREAEKLVEALKNYKGTTHEHLALLTQNEKVRTELEEPFDAVNRLLEELAVTGALYMAIEIGILDALPADGTPISAAALAEAVKVDISAITRSMRVLANKSYVTETSADEYAHNGISQVCRPDGLGALFLLSMDLHKGWAALPAYFKEHKPEDLYDLKKSPIAYSVGKEGLSYYEVLNLDVTQRNIWNKAMQVADKAMPILGMFPFASLKEQVEAEPERPFIVDMAGGRGQALLAIQEECPAGFGAKLILQDLPIVIDSLTPEEIPNIEPTVHDIFTPQPVKNAHVYFMRRILHDFYNPVCLEILKNTVPAMGPDSRLIVCDMVIPQPVDVGGNAHPYWMDFALMLISGKEKTHREFLDMFEEVGLELVKVWPSELGATVMLETRLKRVA
ncbi:hypothetical protein V495_04669 [Pseudogymnoascus sp. VKM F-4514 (FW-929)]|nr:hypothetical protein V495_04669 [Pseudogymnoascus sp. VKM F-4514 (FW-929)]KFY65927.1 hypothetical protein V497_01246 [Pseudogymnoascus sp. VKM F-4516 (FW-969)]